MDPMSMRARSSAARWLRPGLLRASALGLCWVTCVACQADDQTLVNAVAVTATPELASQGWGSLILPLVSAGASQYRLRGAVFEIERSGVALLSLSSDIDPDALELSATLDPGSYEIRLRDGWLLERLGSGALLRAALISPNPVSFSVRNDRQTTVAFTFTTSAGSVTFGAGSVSVHLTVADPESLGACDAARQSGCEGGQTCLLAGDDGQTFCAMPGTLELGEACSAEQCVLGAQCLGLDPARPERSSCTLLCNPAAPPFGCDCRGLRFNDSVGVCGPAPASACDLLDTESCGSGEACQYPGGSFGVCGTPGNAPEGASCFGEECQAGLDCYGDDPAFGFSGTCYQFCDLSAPECEFCFDVGTGSVGRCFI